MTVRYLTAPLDVALAAAQAALAAAPAGTDEEWRLPGGVHAMAAPVLIGAAGKRLHLRGDDTVTLDFAVGGLEMIGEACRITELRVQSAQAMDVVRVTAAEIAVRDLEVPAGTGLGSVTAAWFDAGQDGVIDLDDVEVGAIAAPSGAIGLWIGGGTVRAARLAVGEVTGADAMGIICRAWGAAELTGLSVARAGGVGSALGADLVALGALSVTGLAVGEATAGSATGAIVLGGGDEVRVVDLDLDHVEASAGLARGALIAGGGDVAVRGFDVSGVTGDDALGLVIAGGADGRPGPAVEVGFGRVEEIRSLATAAAGLRVLAARTRRAVVVRDVTVRSIYGGPVPAAPVAVGPPPPPSPAWQSFADAVTATLAAAVAVEVVLPPLPPAEGVVGLQVSAVYEEVQPFVDAFTAEQLAIADCAVAAVYGSAVQLAGGLRTTSIRRVAVDHALHGGYLQGDRLVIANTTWHALRSSVLAGPGEVHAYDSIFSQIEGAGDPLVLDHDADWMAAVALWADQERLRFAALGATPFRDPGVEVPDPWQPGSVVPPADLRLVEGSPLHGLAVAPPPDVLDLAPRPPFAGAFPPEVGPRCELDDPLRPGGAAAEPAPVPGPVVDYRARDAVALVRVMMDRGRTVMAPWSDRGAADFTTMMIELLAERLDHLAYQQERALSEGFLEEARLRRSIEDHVRPLDYAVDPGMSATALIQVRFDFDALAQASAADATRAAQRLAAAEAALAADPTSAALLAARNAAQADRDHLDTRAQVYQELAADGALELPAETLVATASDDRLVFATEAPLTYAAALHELVLSEPAPRGATRARLALAPAAGGGAPAAIEASLVDQLAMQWLIFRRPDGTGHVVRVTAARGSGDVVEIGWDPRRPLPFDAAPAATSVLGNLVVAHHGMRIGAIDVAAVAPDRRAAVEAIRAALDLEVDGARQDEAALPFHPISHHAAGYPFPGEVRRGAPRLQVLVEGEPWTRVDDLAAEVANREVYALRSGLDGRGAIRFATAAGQSALPRRKVAVHIDPVIGLGASGNAGAGVLTRLLRVPFDPARSRFYGDLFHEHPELLREVLRVTNPLPAVEGRDPEPIERIAYRAPLLLDHPLSAVSAEDYVRVASACPEVAGAHARVVPGAVRPIVRVTVLLRDEDTVDDDERLRRWTVVRKALEDARLIGYDVETVPPRWLALDLDVTVEAEPAAEAGAVRDAVIAAVAGHGGLLDPDHGGLGGDVHLADLYRAVGGARGVASAHVRRFRCLGPGEPERVADGVIPVAADEVAIVRGPGRPGAGGVLTVTVCGGLA